MQKAPSVPKLFRRWLEPELFQPFVFGLLISITLSEFVRGALVLSMLPTYGKTVLGFAVEWTALALSIHYLTDNIFRSPVGWLVDRIGQRLVLLVGFCISGAAVFAMMHARTIPWLLITLAVYGIGVTPMWPSAVSGIGLATPDKKRASFMGYIYIFWLAGTGLGPVLINLVIGNTYTIAFFLLMGIDALGFLLAFLLVKKQNIPVGAADGRAAVRSDIAGNGTGRSGTAGSDIAGNGNAIHPGSYDFASLWRNIREVAYLFPGMFAQTFAVASLIPILSLYAKIVLHLSGAIYSAILVSGGVFTVALIIPAGKLVDKYGPRRFLVPAFLAAAVGLGLYPLAHTMVMTFATVIGLGVCYAFILPAWNSVLDHNIDPDKKGALWGVFMTVEGIGSATGPYLGGVMWDVFSPSAPFWVSALVIAAMGVIYVFLPIERFRHAPRGTVHNADFAAERRSRKGRI